jgi:hypothetical protein
MSRCRSCGAPIMWATTVNGARMPLDDEPVPGGTFVLSDPTPGAYAPTALHYSPPDDPPLPGMPEPPRFVSHYATCPDADQWRNPR